MDESLTSKPPTIQVARIVPETRAEGPGARFAVWVQGCTIRCDGCFNPQLWGSIGGTATAPLELATQAVAAGVDGVTLLGGEPFEQAPALAEFAALVRANGLSVMTFTGYERELLESADAPNGAQDLLAETDLLVDGRYRADAKDFTRPWVGSTNQRFHFLTQRYRHLEPQLTALPDRLEVRVSAAGEVAVNGWASVDQLDALLAGTGPTVGRGGVR
ncbi:4Fe-4S single cluster domain-containing protein [Curtobacterium sp. MCBD17_030]|uniref:4Fe-4S single cluster domain-containing protein n=1 Tax=Curtobacterium sp. MCBD17_030 TaxID=2175649 RepID=UPI000D80A978|nr:4Fe-4S single cluster domain-containing protein [Curtobacterium sp. MCBD17_030]PYY32776.1 ribonucleoside-triphosphate reductase activating protein [Curtobacterium sp. MCBD17_030]